MRATRSGEEEPPVERAAEVLAAARAMAEEDVAVVVDGFVPRELCAACARLCVEGLGPLCV